MGGTVQEDTNSCQHEPAGTWVWMKRAKGFILGGGVGRSPGVASSAKPLSSNMANCGYVHVYVAQVTYKVKENSIRRFRARGPPV